MNKPSTVNTAPTFAIHSSPIITDLGWDEISSSISVQTDGKIVVAGTRTNRIDFDLKFSDIALLRYNSDGSLDATFSGDGIVTTSAANGLNSGGNASLLQADGKIVVAGFAGYYDFVAGDVYSFTVARYNSDGSLDTSFSGDGLVATGFAGAQANTAFSVALQTDGKILVAGETGHNSFDTGTHYDIGLVRYNSDGSLDTTFSGDGIVTTDMGNAYAAATCILVQANGKIIVGSNSGLVRYNSNGSLDTTFSGDGKVTDVALSDAILLADGKILATGYNGIERYNSDGSLDTSFNGNGKVSTDFYINSAVLQTNGKLVTAGDGTLARYNSDGSLDTSFSSDGKVSVNFIIASVTLQTDGKILVTGNTSPRFPTDIAVARYNSDGSLDSSFYQLTDSLGNVTGTREGAAPIVIDDHAQISDAELDALNGGAGDYSGTSLTLARHGGAKADDVFAASGTLGLSNGMVTLDGITIGDYQQNAGQLSIHFTAATHQQADSVLQQLAYRNSSTEAPSSVQLDWTFSDGNSTNPLTATGSTTVYISSVNSLPSGYALISGTKALGQTLTASTTLADPDGLGHISYVWQGSSNGTTWSNLGSGTTLVLTQALLSQQIRLTASYTDHQGGYTKATSLMGTNGDDTLSNSGYFQSLLGLDGNDRLYRYGSDADNLLDGGNGKDIADYLYATEGVRVDLRLTGSQNTGGTGRDTLLHIEDLSGSDHNDTLTGNNFANSLFGGNGDDTLNGGGGNDSLIGGAGNDTLDGGAGTDMAHYLTATAGVTVNLGLTGAQNTHGAGTDTLLNIENLNGSIYNDLLIGNAANNTLLGGRGNDVLAGGLGNDILTGGLGKDTFALNTPLSASNIDTVTDFTVPDDTIRLQKAFFTALTTPGVLAAAAFKIIGNGGVADSSDHILYNTATGALFYDADGSGAGAAVRVAVLGTGLAMTNADFMVA